MGPRAWEGGTPRGDHLGPAQALSPPQSPEGETQRHRGRVPDAQQATCRGSPTREGLTAPPAPDASRAGLTWVVRRSPLKGSTGGTPALKLPDKPPPCSGPQFLPATQKSYLGAEPGKRWARMRRHTHGGPDAQPLLFDGSGKPTATRVRKAGRARSILRGGPVSAPDGQRSAPRPSTLLSGPKVLVFSPAPLSVLNLKASGHKA